ncbi:MAG TPA: hypothetical protein VGI81_08485 [Tepidisphaeraceae bacterium]|jgi:hypothetical protein
MRDFQAIIRRVKTEHDIRVRRWRKQMSGCAWQVRYPDGRVVRWIESPCPKTPISLSLFLHEVGHHVIGFETYKRRCEEEYHVWEWAIARMRALGIEPDAKVMDRFERSMRYAVDKAVRRGIAELPESLLGFLPHVSPMEVAPQVAVPIP